MKQAFLWLTLQRAALIAAILLWRLPHPCGADELLVGAATVSITPSEPVALAGQMRTRIADKVQSECLASVLALETRRGQDSVDQAVFVACDLVAIRDGVIESVRARLKDRLPGFSSIEAHYERDAYAYRARYRNRCRRPARFGRDAGRTIH